MPAQISVEATRPKIGALRELGLTTYEAQAYLALIQNQDTSAAQLCAETGIPDSKIYFALDQLQKKGLVVASEGVPRKYRGLRPKDALARLKESMTKNFEGQLRKMDDLAVALDPLYRRSQTAEIELAYVLKGFENVLNRMTETLKTARREVVLFVPIEEIYDRLKPTLVALKRGNVKVRLAVPGNIRRRIDRSSYSEIRTMMPHCEECWLVVVDGKVVISSSEWQGQRCHAIMTEDPVFITMSLEYFQSPRCCTSS